MEGYFTALQGIVRAEAAKAAGQPGRVFDWNRAAQRIRDARPATAEAGLTEDWFWTGGTIYQDGAPYEGSHPYLASLWATPVLLLDGSEEECWIYDNETEWDSSTYWPESARRILSGDAA